MEWLNDSIRGPKDNATVEKVDFTTNEVSDRDRDGNYCQQFMDGFWVSDAQEKIAKHGVASELSYQMLNTSKAIARDYEFAVLKSATAQKMNAGVPGRMGGLRYFIGGKNAKVATFNATNDTATITAHGWRTGVIVTVYKGNGATMPTGLTENASYYCSVVDDNTIKFHLTPEDAEAGTNAVDITDAGTGTIYVTNSNIVSVNGDLSETAFNDLMQKCWMNGANVQSAIVSGKRKRQISGWTAGATKNRDQSDTHLKNVIEIYESDKLTIVA